MATISGNTEEKIFQIKSWGGLNENPDGDTKLKLGEAAVMRNFRVTRDGNLQRRPGSALIKGLMRAYTMDTDATGQVIRRDDGASGQLIMFPTASATNDGFIQVSGESVVVSYGNSGEYAGYYWKYNEDYTYQLVQCTKDEENDCYLWTMKRVKAKATTAEKPVKGLWCGFIKGKEQLVGACDGKLWKLHNGAEFCKVEIGSIDTENDVFMFGYSEILYLMNGKKYMQWDGETLKEVEGYRPLVSVAVAPTGGGTLLEEVNKLNGLRRCQFSPDGTAKTFTLPEKDIQSVDYVKNLAKDETVSTSSYTANTTAGTVTFTTAPAKGISTLEIGWTAKKNSRDKVEAMRFSETFNGATDNRVFIYGDRSNQAFYSGLDYDGNPRADYFPDMNVLKVGDANTPITALIRHYSRLLVYKTSSVYSVQYGVTSLADGSTKAMFYTIPVNRAIGNAAMGQVRLVLNSPFSLFGHDLYEWRNNGSYASNLSVDERQANRMSDRITATLDSFTPEQCYCWDDNDGQEYYICFGEKALVYNYAVDAWYLYDSFPVSCMVNFQGALFYGTKDGKLAELSYRHRTDFGHPIKSYWESGSIDMGKDFMRKYSAMLWVGIKPEEHGEVWVTVQTDKKSTYAQKVVSSSLSTFTHADFSRWSFNTNRKPHMARLKIKAKKFVFYKLLFETQATDSTVTVLSADLRVRYTGYTR